MDINRKKVLIIPLDGVLAESGGLTDFHIRREVLDRIRSLNIQRVAIIADGSDDADYKTKTSAIEYFVFSYCKTAVSVHWRSDKVLNEIVGMLPHNIKDAGHILSVGERIEGIDFLELGQFV